MADAGSPAQIQQNVQLSRAETPSTTAELLRFYLEGFHKQHALLNLFSSSDYT